MSGRTVCRYGTIPVPYHTGSAPVHRPIPVQQTLSHNFKKIAKKLHGPLQEVARVIVEVANGQEL